MLLTTKQTPTLNLMEKLVIELSKVPVRGCWYRLYPLDRSQIYMAGQHGSGNKRNGENRHDTLRPLSNDYFMDQRRAYAMAINFFLQQYSIHRGQTSRSNGMAKGGQ